MASSKQFQDRAATLRQRWQQLWRNPTAVSAIASLGAHGLLFLALPFLPDASTKATESEIRRSVGVVELTPDEQKRLPDFSTLPPIELPPLSTPKPEDAAPFSFSDLPKPSTSAPEPSDSLLAPPPLPIFIPPIAPPPQPYQIQIPTTPPVAASPQPSASPSPTPTETPQSGNTTPEETQSAETEAGQPPTQTNAETTQPTPPPRTEEQIQQDLLARQQELRQLYTYNPSGTSDEEGNIGFANWFREVFGRDFGEGDEKPIQQTTKAEYPKLACPLKQNARAVVGVVVDAENQVISQPKVLQSSGYRLFNEEALKVIESYPFENSTGKEQIYLIAVEFDYSEEICPPGLAPAPTG